MLTKTIAIVSLANNRRDVRRKGEKSTSSGW